MRDPWLKVIESSGNLILLSKNIIAFVVNEAMENIRKGVRIKIESSTGTIYATVLNTDLSGNVKRIEFLGDNNSVPGPYVTGISVGLPPAE